MVWRSTEKGAGRERGVVELELCRRERREEREGNIQTRRQKGVLH